MYALTDLLFLFQSTLPVWGGTGRGRGHVMGELCFNPPSPCGEGLKDADVQTDSMGVSIHPPRVGRDFGRVLPLPGVQCFNPPSPCG